MPGKRCWNTASELLLVLLLDGAAEHDLPFGLGGLVELVEARDAVCADGELRRTKRQNETRPETWRSERARMSFLLLLVQPASSRQSAGAKLISTSWLNW